MYMTANKSSRGATKEFEMRANSYQSVDVQPIWIVDDAEYIVYIGKASMSCSIDNNLTLTIQLYCDQYDSKYHIYSAPSNMKLYVRGINIYY